VIASSSLTTPPVSGTPPQALPAQGSQATEGSASPWTPGSNFASPRNPVLKPSGLLDACSDPCVESEDASTPQRLPSQPHQVEVVPRRLFSPPPRVHYSRNKTKVCKRKSVN